MPGPRFDRVMPSFESVAAGTTAVLRLPLGYTYHKLMIGYSDPGAATFPLADLNEIRVVINGAVMHRYSGEQLDAINRFYGDPAAGTDDYINIHFDRRGIRQRNGVEITGLGCGPRVNDPSSPLHNPNPITTAQIEVDIGSATTTAPALTANALVSDPSPSGIIRKVKRFIWSPSAAGDFEIDNLPLGDVIMAAHFHKAADDMNALQIEKNNRLVFDRTDPFNDQALASSDFPRTPQAAYFHYDPAEDGYGDNALYTHNAADLRWRFTLGSGGTLTGLIEYAGPIAR